MVVSNRGPVSFRRDDGKLVARRGAGGLVSGIAPLVAGADAIWIAAAMSDADREAARDGLIDAEGLRVRLVDVEPDTYGQAYDVVCNATLWFIHHALFDLARRPRFDELWRDAWAAYRRFNEAFADVVADEAPEGAAVLVQDYHLCLVASALAERRRDLRVIHFSHTPFATPDQLRVLSAAPRRELIAGLAAFHACGFHTRRWAAAFEACAQDLELTPTTFVSPLAADPSDLGAVANSAACEEQRRDLDELIGDRRFILRVDRIELSKNLLRGFWAFDDLLTRHPEWRGRVVFGAFVYPSREGLPEYLAYRQEVETTVRQLNDKWSTPEWTPIVFDPSDDFPRSVAALQRYDVLLVNPIRDGLNLVAKEGAVLNRRDGVILLSTEAGAIAEMEEAVMPVEPFDVAGTADALHRALQRDSAKRIADAAKAREIVEARTPADWLDDQLAAAFS